MKTGFKFLINKVKVLLFLASLSYLILSFIFPPEEGKLFYYFLAYFCGLGILCVLYLSFGFLHVKMFLNQSKKKDFLLFGYGIFLVLYSFLQISYAKDNYSFFKSWGLIFVLFLCFLSFLKFRLSTKTN